MMMLQERLWTARPLWELQARRSCCHYLTTGGDHRNAFAGC